MPQIINTNLASLNAQRNLDRSSSNMQTSLQRLSSGLRINSAKDDAAGLAISVRFSSRIQGLSVAQRNANDAISLAQVSEGALQQGSKILQRCRELSIQAANSTNSASDRKALQSEVNQLKQELSRIASTTTFNGLNVLNGELNNSTFQVGSEANQTISISIRDTRATAIGSNQVKTNNVNGIEAATRNEMYYKTGTDIATGAGAVTATANNAYLAATFTVTSVSASGVSTTNTVATSANDSAATIATALNTLTGVSASAFSKVSMSALTASDTNFVLSLNGIAIGSAATTTFSSMATIINANTNFANSGIYAVASASGVDVFATQGHNLAFVTGAAFGGNTVTLTGIRGTGGAALTGNSATSTVGGKIDIALNQGLGISASVAAQTFVTNGALSTVKVGNTGVTGGNFVGAQNLTVVGSSGSSTVAVSAQQTAESIAVAVNAVSGSTNVTATGRTIVKLDQLSANGQVNFTLIGNDSNGSSISATVTQSDLTTLVGAINGVAGATGVTAAVGASNAEVMLTHETGKDIKIKDFVHNAAVDYQAPTASTLVAGDGSAVTAANEVSMVVTGNPSSNAGSSVTLYDGSSRNGRDSTVVGGEVIFKSSQVFSVTSSTAGSSTASGASLFTGAAASANTSSLSSVGLIDISSAAGAQDAISVLDDAINQISEIRADLGAIQSRFESSIENLANNVENLSAARSRTLDADFAAETANLTKNQILQQAGIAILAQANQLPQSALSLLK